MAARGPQTGRVLAGNAALRSNGRNLEAALWQMPTGERRLWVGVNPAQIACLRGLSQFRKLRSVSSNNSASSS